jgi:type IV pilus assembly protein PilA
MKKQLQKGFTLIELMIVVAIIGILASIALPAYQDYIARGQASESVVMLDGARTAAEDISIQNGAFPANSATAALASTALNGANTTGTYGDLTVAESSNDAGELIYTFKAAGSVNANLAAKTVTYTRTTLTGAWDCTSNLAAKFQPKGCGS